MNKLLELKVELKKPEYDGLGATAALAVVHLFYETSRTNFMLTSTSAMREFGSEASNVMMKKFEQAASGSEELARALPLLKPSEGGMNTSEVEFQNMIDGMGNNLPFSASEVTGLKALGYKPHYTFSWANVQDIIDARHL